MDAPQMSKIARSRFVRHIIGDYPMTTSNKLRSIIRRMLKLFRMWRFTVLVNNLTKDLYTDDFYRGWYEDEPLKYKSAHDITVIFENKLILVRNKAKREFIANRIRESALKNGYVQHPTHAGKEDSTLLQVQPDKGEKLIDVFPNGFLRELITKEWKFIALLLPLVTALVGYLIGRYN